MQQNRIFITGIGTDIGKTVVSAIVCKAMQAAYWKPIQSGALDDSDSMKISQWLGPDQQIIKETYRLTAPLSPHAAAAIDKVDIQLAAITGQYKTLSLEKNILIEGAGGLMVPLNKDTLVIDLIQSLKVPVILVSRNYLGSINHTLLSIEALKSRNIPVKGIIFNGESNAASEDYILEYSKLPCLLRVPYTETVDRAFIEEQAALLHIE